MTEIIDLTDANKQELAEDFRESNQPLPVWARGGATLENGDFVPEEILLANGDAIQWFAGSKG